MTALNSPGELPEKPTNDIEQNTIDEVQAANSLKQILAKLNDQDALTQVLELETHAHFRSGEERSPPY